jgi:molybdenum cofactor cytidylyltransferase
MSEIGAVVLAAGLSARFRAEGGLEISKLVVSVDGKPLVRHAVEAALASRARPVVVVTGYAREAVEPALTGLPVVFVDNADFASGLSSSLKIGVAALPNGVAGALVLLGDMPAIKAVTLDLLIDAFAARPQALAAVPVHAGRRGNPALLSRTLFPALARLTGDEGARRLISEADPERIVELDVESDGVTLDINTPDELAAVRNLLTRISR